MNVSGVPDSDLADAAEAHSDALEVWLAARGPDVAPAAAWLEKARARHRELDEAACRESIPPCWRGQYWKRR